MFTVFIAAASLTGLILMICFALMAAGLIFRGKSMRGGCGSGPEEHDDGTPTCPHCAEKKKTGLCGSEGDRELVEAAKLGTIGRFDDKE